MAEPRRWTDLGPGEEFAGYRIERSLGRGGMGILYLALEPGLERRVALKLIAPEAAAEEVFARRFAEESRIAASIEHPNVVPIYAAGEEGGVPFIAMRYVAGSDLGRRAAREGRLDPRAAVRLIGQVGDGLDAIHAAGLVHRDVKPANVLLSGEEGAEHAYITDFGVARNLATESGLTQTGRFVGTLDYVAPEQISGGRIDARVDVYALGCLLYKLLTGQIPFPREGEAARLYAHLNDPPPAPSLYLPSLPMALDDVVIRALSKQPGDRYQSAGDLGRAAAAALSGSAVSTPERSVARGAAATVEPETVRDSKPTAAAGHPIEPTAATPRLRPQPPEALTEPRVGGPKRRPLVLAGALAAVAAIVVAGVLLSSGGGDGDGGGGGVTTTSAQGSGDAEPVAEKDPKPEPEPQRLSSSALVSLADRICERAQDSYVQTVQGFADPESEAGMSVEYAEQLVGISSRQLREMRQLVPPKSKQDEFREYLESREEVAEWDEDALRAARADNPAAYLEAYERRNNTQADRERIADEIGFEVCSQ